MVDDRLQDGVRIAQLLASEITGEAGRLRDLQIADADPDVEPTREGALAYRIVQVPEPATATEADTDTEPATAADDDATPIAAAYVHPDRVRLEYRVGAEAVVTAAEDAGLRVRPKAVQPPRTIVFLEDGAAVKQVRPAIEAARDAMLAADDAHADEGAHADES